MVGMRGGNPAIISTTEPLSYCSFVHSSFAVSSAFLSNLTTLTRKTHNAINFPVPGERHYNNILL